MHLFLNYMIYQMLLMVLENLKFPQFLMYQKLQMHLINLM